jgi:hypothetical protein
MNVNLQNNANLNRLIKIITFLTGIIALSLLLSKILPLYMFGFHFKSFVNSFHLMNLMVAISIIGVVIAVVLLLFKKKETYLLLIFSLFNLVFPYAISAIKSSNQQTQMNVQKKPQDLYQELLFGIKFNMPDKVKASLENGANANDAYSGTEFIYLAVKNKNTEIAKILIEHGASLNIYNDSYSSPLYLAVKNNDFKMVELLLKNNAPVNIKIKHHAFNVPAPITKEDFGKTPLHIAVQNNNYQLATLLLEHGADLTVVDDENKNAYSYAQNSDMKYLLEQHTRNSNG